MSLSQTAIRARRRLVETALVQDPNFVQPNFTTSPHPEMGQLLPMWRNGVQHADSWRLRSVAIRHAWIAVVAV
jgi:hypothetical protein